MPKFMNKYIHAYLDYPVAIGLMLMPFLLGLGESSAIAFSLSVATGVAAFILTILSDHHLGVVKILPYRLHLIVDGVVGAVFVAAPFLLGFSGIDALYYWVLGVTVLAVVTLDNSETPVATQ